MSNWEAEYHARRVLATQAGLGVLAKLKERCIAENAEQFEIHGYGSGDSPEGTDISIGSLPAFISADDLDALDGIGWNVTGSDYNNEGGGYRIHWSKATQELTVTGYHNTSSTSDHYNTTV